MSQEQQPEALRLATFYALQGDQKSIETAQELRRQQARIAELEREKAELHYKAMAFEAQLEAIGAGGVETLRKRECLQQSAQREAGDEENVGVSTLNLTQAQLQAYLTYDPDTGVFTSLASGKSIGWKGWKGYVSVAVYDVTYRAHRLAWLYITGEWPKGLLDHRDGDKSNNRFNNLRECTHSQNSANGIGKKNNSGLPRGVRKTHGAKTFKAEISINSRKIHLGCYSTEDEAYEVYALASELVHGDYAYHLSRDSARAEQGGYRP